MTGVGHQTMCGIFVSLADDNITNKKKALNIESLRLLGHRGPDTQMYNNHGRLFMGHTRLEIIDHNPASNQPYESSCGRYVVVFNGEIYNYRELSRLYLRDLALRTQSDTEVIVELWRIFGARMLRMLDGMFAIVVLDRLHETVTVARDIFGIKPMYRYSDGRQLIFSSEIRPILNHIERVRENKNVISHFLFYGLYDHTEQTFFNDIFSCKPAHATSYSLVDSRLLSDISFFEPSDLNHKPVRFFSPTDALHELTEILDECVTTSTIADAPIGVNISGGVDSSLLYSLLSTSEHDLPGLNMSFPKTLDEAYINTSSLGYKYHRVGITHIDIIEHLKDVARHQSQPFGGACVVAYSVLYSYAKELGIRVTLDGNGLDEMFLGYTKYRSTNIPIHSAYHDGTSSRVAHILGPNMPSPDSLEFHPLSIEGFSPVRNEAMNDLFYKKIPRGLRFNDHVSMQHSIELRVPFLRKRLLEFSVTLPDQFLMSGSVGKLPIRRVLGAFTGNSVHAFAPKASVQSPQTEWLHNELLPLVNETVLNSRFFDRGWVNPSVALQAIRSQQAFSKGNSFFVWQMINLELMAQMFLD
jgi:asparagine synthase (glutamine-hydrolysing)